MLAMAESLLVAGADGEARRVLDGLDPRVSDEPSAASLEFLADLLTGVDGAQPADPSAAGVDTESIPVALMIRGAFERGDFDAALRLTEGAQAMGWATVPAITAAVQIESRGMPSDGTLAAARVSPTAGLSSRLLERLGNYLDDSETTTFAKTSIPGSTSAGSTDSRLFLRDRQGLPVGALDGGELTLDPGVDRSLIPHRVADLAARQPTTGVGSSKAMRLSLDLELSAAAQSAFGRWYRGSIVLLDPRSGEILAAVSDRRSHRQGLDPVFEERREPASIAKLITTTAALRAGLDPDAELARMRCRGHERYAGELLYCPHIAGPLRGLDRALGISCNVAFANLGVAVGRRGVVEEFRRYGFDRPFGPFPGAQILGPDGDDRQLADLSIGLDVSEITPLHAALLAAVMVNDGVMPEPTLVSAVDGRLGLHPRALPRGEGLQVLDPAWLPGILQAMEAVAERGTARRIAPRSFPVAMKTGTASHPRHGFHVNYIGVGPMPHTRLAFCVRITHQPTSKKVRTAARAVTERLLRNLGGIAIERHWLSGPPAPAKPWTAHQIAAVAPPSPKDTETPSGVTVR